MIQRIQTVYLTLTTILSLLFLRGTYLTFVRDSGETIKITFYGIARNSGSGVGELIGTHFLLTSLFVLIPVLSLIAIFFFKRRDIQMWLASANILLTAGLIVTSAYYCFVVYSDYKVLLPESAKIALPVLILFFAIMAFRGIRKDDDLVKSYDRLR